MVSASVHRVSCRLHRDFSYIVNNLFTDNNNTATDDTQMDVDEDKTRESSQCLLILLALALSCVRKLKVEFLNGRWMQRTQISIVAFQHLHSRLVALELLRLMIPLVDDQIILDRILPYVVRRSVHR